MSVTSDQPTNSGSPSSRAAPSPSRLGTVRGAVVIAGNDLRRKVRDKSIFIQAVIAPVLLAFVVGAAFGSGPQIDITVAVADADGSPLSEQIVTGLTDASDPDRGVTFAAASTVNADELAQQVDDGEVDSVILIPAGTAEDLTAGAPVQLQVIADAANQLGGSVATAVAEGIAAQLQTSRVAVATLTGVADEVGVGVDVDAALAAAAEAPAAVAIAEAPVDGDFSIMAYFAPGMAMLFLFFIVGEGARSIVVERDEGTLPRMLAAPINSSSVLVGKTLGVFVLGVVSLTTVWLVTSLVFGVDWGDPVGVALVIVAVVISIAGISLLITGVSRTRAQAEATTIIAALGFAVLGGTFFVAAGGLVAFTRWFTPNGQALAAFIDLSAGGASAVDVLPRVLLLVASGLVTGAIGLVALRRKVGP